MVVDQLSVLLLVVGGVVGPLAVNNKWGTGWAVAWLGAVIVAAIGLERVEHWLASRPVMSENVFVLTRSRDGTWVLELDPIAYVRLLYRKRWKGSVTFGREFEKQFLTACRKIGTILPGDSRVMVRTWVLRETGIDALREAGFDMEETEPPISSIVNVAALRWFSRLRLGSRFPWRPRKHQWYVIRWTARQGAALSRLMSALGPGGVKD